MRRYTVPAAAVCFPSPQGGSETALEAMRQLMELPFHPLKAGRRLSISDKKSFKYLSFPSPQGGSETWKFLAFAPKILVSIPSRRVGDA